MSGGGERGCVIWRSGWEGQGRGVANEAGGGWCREGGSQYSARSKRKYLEKNIINQICFEAVIGRD